MNPTEAALSEALNQTGFPFEHHVFRTMTARGWRTRSSRLYVDGEEGKTREMDLLCYRISKGEEVTTCTALIVSCKARHQKPWVLLTRAWPDRSLGWLQYPPVPVWSNSNAVSFEVGRSSWGLDYFNFAEATGLRAWAADSPGEVFALQEFEAIKSHSHGKKPEAGPKFNAKGDSSLYEGAMSLLKALAYEVAAVDGRRRVSKEKFVYQFNLLQLLDGDLYEASFSHDPPKVGKVDRYRYFARTMLAGKDFSSRIEFCTKAALPALCDELAKLHEFNCQHFDARAKSFYRELLRSPERLEALLPELEAGLRPMYRLHTGDDEQATEWLRVRWAEDEGLLKVVLVAEPEVVARLNGKPHFMTFLKRVVARVFRYDGPIALVDDYDDIPF